MTSSQRALAAASLSALLVLGASACSSSGSVSSSSAAAKGSAAASPSVAQVSADELANKAVAALGSAGSLRFKGTVKDTSGNISFDMQLVRGKGCTGTMGVASQGSFKMTVIGKKIWIKPDTAFWKTAGLPTSAMAKLHDKYLATTLDSKAFGSFGDFCDLSKMAKGFGSTSGTGMERGAFTTVDGQSVVTVTDPSDGSHAYITDGAEPKLVRLSSTGADGGQLDFLDYGKPATVAPPKKSQTVDGAQYGF